MLNYLKKFAMDILPSVAATIIGAYIVNHYITAKPADAHTEPASIPPVEPRRKPAAPREKPIARTAPAPVTPPVVATPVTVPPAETAATPDERHDANDLARAAIERLRGTTEGSPHG